MAAIRKPFQGVRQIIEFNAHWYILILVSVLVMSLAFDASLISTRVYILALMALLCPTFISLIVSFYIYDLSNLYELDWLKLKMATDSKIANIHAGFDETSSIIYTKFSPSCFHVFDFYNPAKHTEISIKRARKKYPPYPNTTRIETTLIPLENYSIDYIFVLFSAHEIRNDDERIQFFLEMKRVLKPNGNIILVEHVRDWPNMLAYTVGGFHFLSQRTWMKTFTSATMKIERSYKKTPFVRAYILS